MDFKKKLWADFFKHLKKVKFSIRLSILSLVLILLIGVAFLIISINYFTTNSILVASAKDSLSQSSSRAAEQIENYLEPLNSNILTAYRMFREGVVDPKKPSFIKFLSSLIIDNDDLISVYWGDAAGSIYLLNKEKDGFFEEIVLRNDKNKIIKATKREFNLDGRVLTTEKMLVDDGYDPRSRPWYQHAKLRKSLTWVVYRFARVGKQQSQLGITSAFPVYDSQGNLLGVFGIDMLLNAVSGYIKKIELTDNGFIFVVDSAGKLISTHAEQENPLALDKAPNISAIKKPWLKKSFDLYQKMDGLPFIYSINGEKYVAAYKKISHAKSDTPWFVAIVTPIDDIIAPLRKNVLLSSMFTGLVLLIGIIFASIFASSLSRPIKALAQDANLICKLRLEAIKHLFSRIKEIAEMADSFIKMKNALYSFQRYMPVALVRKLIVSNKIASVGGESKELTLLFTDIQDFTKLSENFDPEALMHYLSEYFQSITQVILEMQGTVDKYIGDGVMAFWGAPIDDNDHTLHACQATLKVQQALQKLNKKWRKEGKPELVSRFGLNTGRVVVGNVGSDDRLGYTSLGDPVNLASRLEVLNKTYGTTIMVSEFVYKKMKDRFNFRLLDRVAVRGKTEGVYIYELLGELSSDREASLKEFNKKFNRAFSSYEKGDWQEALSLFVDLKKEYPDDKVVQVFISRLTGFIKKPPAVWNGVWIMGEK